MTTPRRVGGYADTDLLERSLRLNEELADQLGDIADCFAASVEDLPSHVDFQHGVFSLRFSVRISVCRRYFD